MSYRARKYPSYDAAVFHAQQCAEKYLKARLEEAAVGFARTHDLLMLHQLVVPVEPTWQVLQTPSPSSIRLPWRIAILASSPPELMPKMPLPIAEKCDA